MRKLRSKEGKHLLNVTVKRWGKNSNLRSPVNHYITLPLEYMSNQNARQRVKSTPWVI